MPRVLVTAEGQAPARDRLLHQGWAPSPPRWRCGGPATTSLRKTVPGRNMATGFREGSHPEWGEKEFTVTSLLR